MKLHVLGSARARFRCIVGMWWGALGSMVLSSLPVADPSQKQEFASGELVESAYGARVYAYACAACHGPDGTGISALVPTLQGSRWLAQASDQAVAAALLHGIGGPLSPGRPANSVMPALGLWLDDVQIAASASYARAKFTGRAAPLSPDTVADVRDWRGTRTIPWTWPELSHALSRPFLREQPFTAVEKTP